MDIQYRLRRKSEKYAKLTRVWDPFKFSACRSADSLSSNFSYVWLAPNKQIEFKTLGLFVDYGVEFLFV